MEYFNVIPTASGPILKLNISLSSPKNKPDFNDCNQIYLLNTLHVVSTGESEFEVLNHCTRVQPREMHEAMSAKRNSFVFSKKCFLRNAK